ESFITHEYATPWLQLMHQEMLRIEAGHSDINPYALTNEAEFLAVASEYFFEKPIAFKNKHPELYAQLSRIFEQQPDYS
uniref:zinc-dependent peptidase n=1 Tax=Pedobacter sp. TaxID=1411316 RepID=UPI003D7FC67A